MTQYDSESYKYFRKTYVDGKQRRMFTRAFKQVLLSVIWTFDGQHAKALKFLSTSKHGASEYCGRLQYRSPDI